MKKSVLKIAAMAVLAFAGVAVSQAQPICADCGLVGSRPVVNLSTLADGSGNINAGVTLLCSNIYKLDKRIYVTDGRTLTIQAGTIIKADTNVNASTAKALIVAQGGKILAEGTAECPIIFTAASDPLDGTKPLCEREEWGGVILLGKAQNNVRLGDTHPDSKPVAFADFVGYIEGLPVPDIRHHYGQYPSTAAAGARQFYNNDNSGVLRYVSIRYGGRIIGSANEINGLTMGSVGNQTVIDHVEVVANQDDAFEFFGGTVNVKRLIAVGHGDDAFDWDQNYRGKGQFLYAVNMPGSIEPTQGTHGLELDGNDKDGRTPVSYGRFYNVTVIGNNTATNIGIEAKAETAGEVVNSIFANYTTAGLKLTKNKTADYFYNDSLIIKCNTFVGVSAANRIVVANLNGRTLADYQTKFDNASNTVVASLAGMDLNWEFTGDNCNPTAGQTLALLTGKVDQVPDAATTTCPKPEDDFFEYAPYRGAFNPIEEPWTKGWTYYSNLGSGVQDVLCPTDLNGDGATGVDDYLEVVGAFGTSCQ